jgi:hypothetical protein
MLRNFVGLIKLLMIAAMAETSGVMIGAGHGGGLLCIGLYVITLFTGTNRVEALTLCDDIGIDQVFWKKEIIKRLFKVNTFLSSCVRADEYVVGGSAVVIPQPGAAPTVVKNNSSFPMVAVQRADSMVMYPLNTYTTVPTFITLRDLQNISYDKTQSVLTDHFGYVLQTTADDQLIGWADALPGATNVLYTTGDATEMLESGQTGQRNTCHWKDVKELSRLMSKGNVAAEGRVLLMEVNMYDQFTTSLSATQQRDFSQYYDAKTGVLGKMFGFDIMTRSSVIAAASALDADSNLDVKALGAALAASDNVGCLAWQRDCLELAMGNVHLFTRTNDPMYTGDVSNVQIKAGGRRRRADNAGVYALMQGTPA